MEFSVIKDEFYYLKFLKKKIFFIHLFIYLFIYVSCHPLDFINLVDKD